LIRIPFASDLAIFNVLPSVSGLSAFTFRPSVSGLSAFSVLPAIPIFRSVGFCLTGN
jgi:hypothetical protein